MDSYEIDDCFDFNNSSDISITGLEDQYIDISDNIQSEELTEEIITEANKPYRETFVIPIEHFIRIENND